MNYDLDTDVLIHPRRGKKEKLLPDKGILLVNPSEASECHQLVKDKGGESRFLFNSQLTVDHKAQSFVAGPAIGAPMAVLCLEKLIVLGAKKIILFGWCGAIDKDLKIGDVILPTEVKSGEGTSQYYPLDSQALPSSLLRSDLEKLYNNYTVKVHPGCVWSTDAVYREHRKMLQSLHLKSGVVAVDMEFSALCTVACFRGIEFAAVLVVSDELWGVDWRPGFAKDKFLEKKEQVLRILLNNF